MNRDKQIDDENIQFLDLDNDVNEYEDEELMYQ